MPVEDGQTRVVILGAGFAGLYAALHLDRTLGKDPSCEVVLIDHQNFMLFTPMLHEVACGDLDASTIVIPVRKALRRTTFYEAEAEGIDIDRRIVTISYGIPRRRREIAYDHLLITTGSETRFPNDESIKSDCVTMKTIGDAVMLRNRMIALLERAQLEEDPAARKALLTFAVAGGGFAGVETIGAMSDFLSETTRYYPNVTPEDLRLVLIHSGDVVLPEFDAKLGNYAAERLREHGIEIVLNCKVKDFERGVVYLDNGQTFGARTLVWTAGVTPPRIVEDLPLKKEKGRLVVDATMNVPGRPELWAAGDSAWIPNPLDGGNPQPGTAQHAIREGRCVARNIEKAVRGKREQITAFKYKTMGQLATIGHRRGAAQIFGFRFSGLFAWWLWRTAYLLKLPHWDRKLRVVVSWTMDILFTREMVQIITLRDLEMIRRPNTARIAESVATMPERPAEAAIAAEAQRQGERAEGGKRE